MQSSGFWPNLINTLRTEQGMSVRQLTKMAGMNRSTLMSCLDGRSEFKVDQIETILEVFGFELEIVPKSE